MNNINYKTIAIFIGLALVFSLGMNIKLYQEAQLYKVNQEEFTEFQKTKTEQQKKLEKLMLTQL